MINWDALNESDFLVYGILFHAGVRPRAKILDRRYNGRNKNGFLYLFSGKVEFFDADGNSMCKAAANDLIYIPKGVKYRLCNNEETHFALINFEMKSADENDFIFFSKISTVIKSNTNTELISIFKRVEKADLEAVSISVFKCKELTYRLFSCISESAIEYGEKNNKIALGVQILRERYLENIPITELAAACYVSVSTFRNLFSEQFGMSPLQYRNLLRIKRAKALISNGDYTIAEVASLSGFSSESYFCRYYKKIVGTTPSSNGKET